VAVLQIMSVRPHPLPSQEGKHSPPLQTDARPLMVSPAQSASRAQTLVHMFIAEIGRQERLTSQVLCCPAVESAHAAPIPELRVQERPFPVKPGLQTHLASPAESVWHVAFGSHVIVQAGCWMGAQEKPSPTKPGPH
jgi:hypothetical protein